MRAVRIVGVATVVIMLLFTGAGGLSAQTADIQRTVETNLALARLRSGARIFESIRVVGQAALEEPVRQLHQAGAALGRLCDRLAMQVRRPTAGKGTP